MMANESKVSLVIPVHNGEKYINHLYRNINKQSFQNIEIVFVEDFSKDNSMNLLNAIAENNPHVIVLECKEPGTSMARKMGVEYATGKYIVFMDQDDKYINGKALEMMYNTIVETGTSVCQFSNYKEYKYGIKKKSRIIDCRRIISAREVLEKEMGSMFESYGGGVLTPSVWSKIYDASLLKHAVNNIDFSLYYAEDLFLNTCCFCSKYLKTVCVDPSAYYVWNVGVGFSSSENSANALIKDYNIAKPRIHQMLMDSKAGEEVVFRLHLESLYFMATYLISVYSENELYKNYKLVESINEMSYIKLAKDYVNNYMDKKRQFEELMFLASDFTPEEFYKRFKHKDSLNDESVTKRIINRLIK